MPADPVVSPADTIRQRVDAAEADGWYAYGEEAIADVRALLAVGERDKAEIERLTRGWADEVDEKIRERERDRRQIAQLTSGLERIAAHPHGGILVNIARAVLADEEDARP